MYNYNFIELNSTITAFPLTLIVLHVTQFLQPGDKTWTFCGMLKDACKTALALMGGNIRQVLPNTWLQRLC